MANKKTNNKTKNKIKRDLKKVNKTYIILFVVFVLIGACIGAGTLFYFTKDDVFKLVGQTEITLNVGDAYVEEGVKCISFGKDISLDKDKIVTTGTVNTEKAGVYVIKYTTTDIRYKNVTLYRKITIIEEGEQVNG